MIYAGVLLLWLIAGMSFVSMSATVRLRTPTAWLSGFITAIAAMNTFVVFALS